MVRCKFLFLIALRRCLPLLPCLLATLFGACPSQAQNLQSDPVIYEDKRALGSISVRDMSIPRRAYEDFQRGLQQLQKQDAMRSMRYFWGAIDSYPQYYEAYYHIGVAQKRLGQDASAMNSFQKAIDLSAGKYPLAGYAMALLLCKQGNTKEAERSVRYALEQGQTLSLGEVVLGTVLLYQHRIDEAEKAVREALSLDDTFSDAYLVLAGVHGERGDYVGEVQDLDEFLNHEPESPRSGQVRSIRDVAESLAVHTAAQP
jgi:Tfp pilus assembly protein PilF